MKAIPSSSNIRAIPPKKAPKFRGLVAAQILDSGRLPRFRRRCRLEGLVRISARFRQRTQMKAHSGYRNVLIAWRCAKGERATQPRPLLRPHGKDRVV